ncbi:unnamed protein product [Dovyalis caffra]|uniref:Uncharacterized protein n=1 Tax=Dovyalis caffra TaxID=77055 RepID=A0AAV1SPB3_9ROSI|nr:unnamed protein product [Dovyalis caffra]
MFESLLAPTNADEKAQNDGACIFWGSKSMGADAKAAYLLQLGFITAQSGGWIIICDDMPLPTKVRKVGLQLARRPQMEVLNWKLEADLCLFNFSNYGALEVSHGSHLVVTSLKHMHLMELLL